MGTVLRLETVCFQQGTWGQRQSAFNWGQYWGQRQSAFKRGQYWGQRQPAFKYGQYWGQAFKWEQNWGQGQSASQCCFDYFPSPEGSVGIRGNLPLNVLVASDAPMGTLG